MADRHCSQPFSCCYCVFLFRFLTASRIATIATTAPGILITVARSSTHWEKPVRPPWKWAARVFLGGATGFCERDRPPVRQHRRFCVPDYVYDHLWMDVIDLPTYSFALS